MNSRMCTVGTLGLGCCRVLCGHGPLVAGLEGPKPLNGVIRSFDGSGQPGDGLVQSRGPGPQDHLGVEAGLEPGLHPLGPGLQ